MSIFDRLIGNAGKIDNQSAENLLEGLLITNETVEITFKLIRDYVIFTNKRLIIMDIQGATGTKKLIQSIPYKSISRFNIETAGTTDMDSEIEIYISSSIKPVITLELGRNRDHIFEISRILGEELLK